MKPWFNKEKTWACVISVLFLVVISEPSAMAADNTGRMSQKVRELAKGGSEFVDVIVTYKEISGQVEADRVNGLGADIKREYGRLPIRAMSIPAHALKVLAKNKSVKFISEDKAVISLSESALLTANEPTKYLENSQFHGLGVRVAVIDSGVYGGA